LHLIVGLGNPGREHEGQRHNVGFVVVDELRCAWGVPDFRTKFSALLTRGEAPGGLAVGLLEPQTYMNHSGDAVQPAAAFFGVEPAAIVVVHDELDLPFGQVRVKMGGGHAGHNGLRSIIARLGTPDFARVRVGIGKPPAAWAGDVASWVLGRFDAAEKSELPAVVTRAADAVSRIVASGVAAAMNIVNGPPPGPATKG
jgi:PTH1 family peptidyl-tRNA hydrolase